ncbi:MFS transporter [Thalassococcus sp. S3]|uniref:MFS transporter n=1 Tax=Thalassococcus sp. S3 TaxID=2017482 RepID=UPI00102485A5|nr:MFS transporter [Thalassococcus sp. S3]QBF32242.1 hypothetical protein CFI11_13575 [Thalassococcus sp. S3]
MAPDRTSFGVVFAVWIAGLGSAAQFAKVSVTFDALSAHYGETGATLGFAVSLVGLVGILLGVVAGLLVARTGYRRSLLAALLLGALVSAWQATLPPFALLLVSRAIEGISHLAIVVAAPTLIAQYSAVRHRGFTLSLWSTFFGVAFALLAWFGVPFAAAYGMGALYAAHAAYMAAMALLIWWQVPADKPRSTDALPSGAQLLSDHLRIYRSPRLSAPALGWVFYAASFLAILTIMPRFLAPEMRETVIGIAPLIGIAVSMTLGVLLLRLVSAVVVAQAGFLGCVACSLLIWAMPMSIWPYLMLFGAMGLIQGASFAAVPQLNSDAAGQAAANGAVAQMGNVGTTLGTPLLAALVASADTTGFLIFGCGAFCAGFFIHAILSARRRHDDL